MGLTTEGRAPGPVRYRLVCDRGGCTKRVSFDLVIAEPPPDRETDFFGHLLHEARQAVGYVEELGWMCVEEGQSYWCPDCSGAAGR
ncbi:hypothetical protein [Streptomyces caatingaensis]|uniref:Uncharacterized protein n=1 Tax=Streptomyces caatingaensis TaxID=1678637 RepID=A0A0K9XLY8_9ACTN|nr:hypothetical protein [Streptomyces caatingaensis]KNB54253.1 hypothetical protein AC230_04775 [Streptomyces caatingaensis]